MSKSTLILHESLLRMAKGMVKAWESWLNEQKTK